MSVAYCIKCKCKKELKETFVKYASNGAPMEMGKCTACGTKTARFLTKVEKEALTKEAKPVEKVEEKTGE